MRFGSVTIPKLRYSHCHDIHFYQYSLIKDSAHIIFNIYQNTQLTTLLLTSTRIRFCTLSKWLRRRQILRRFEQISEPGFKCFSRMMMMASSFPAIVTTIISVSVVWIIIRSKWISSGWWRWWITSRWQWLVRTTWQYLTLLKKI